MRLTIATCNINSVRLRIDSVARFIKTARPDVLCLQETKCPDDRFPRKRFRRLGYEHIALNGQKGYHGVVVVSRLPLESFEVVPVVAAGGVLLIVSLVLFLVPRAVAYTVASLVAWSGVTFMVEAVTVYRRNRRRQ